MKATFEDYTIEYSITGSQLICSRGDETIKVLEIHDVNYGEREFKNQVIKILKSKCSDKEIKYQL